MMAAVVAGEAGKSVLLLEKNKRLGEKLAISGGGRCNITNAEPDQKKILARYGAAEKFLHSPFSQFDARASFPFFESRGLPLMVEANNRAFPTSQRAVEVVLALEKAMRSAGVEIMTGVTVKNISAKDGAIVSIEAMGRQLSARSYILATGGLSHPETGSTGDGFTWLRTLGHTINAPTPSLVPLRTKESWTKSVSGVTLPDIKLTFTSVGGKKFSRIGPLLFSHTGISGPTVLNAAAEVGDWLQEGTVAASIDLFAAYDYGTLDDMLLATFIAHKNKLVRNAVSEFAPAGMGELLLALLPTIDSESQVNALSKESRRAIVDLMKNIPLTIISLMGFDKAVVADGGISLVEVDTRTMRSRKIKNLFITGDLLHISRPSGGYSLQLCWTTGFVAGTNA